MVEGGEELVPDDDRIKSDQEVSTDGCGCHFPEKNRKGWDGNLVKTKVKLANVNILLRILSRTCGNAER